MYKNNKCLLVIAEIFYIKLIYYLKKSFNFRKNLYALNYLEHRKILKIFVFLKFD